MPFLASIEPMLPSEKAIAQSDLPDKALSLLTQAAELKGKVSPITAQVLEEHMRVINSYYSNLIEGNSTHPRDIREAISGKYKADNVQRDLQLESLAHVEVQQALQANLPNADALLSADFIAEIHRLFYQHVPFSLRQIKARDGERVLEVSPGQIRSDGQEVEVGQHLPPNGKAVSNYLSRFQEAYRLDRLKGVKRVIAAMASHHRLAWIHPFMDGNGRVARLHTDTFLKVIGVGATGIWCLSRGLARSHVDYKHALAQADHPRRGDGDGRGALSESSLVAFCDYMFDVAIDQVEFMDDLLQLKGMATRIQSYVRARNDGLIPSMAKLKPEAARLLDQAFRFGEFPRAEMESVSGLGLSVTRKLVKQLKDEGLLTETSSRSPLRFAIPMHAEPYYLPNLAPL
jgi:Fic family protein